jgi:RHS repeat-associated protein
VAGQRLIAETNHKEHYRSFVYEPGTYKPLAQLEGKGKTAGVYYYHLDHLGTLQELTSTTGKLVWAVQYRAYGNVVRTIANDIETPLRFQGQYFDTESGLHYNRHRYYQPETGRFLTPDPIKLAGGLNNYQYVPNPVNWVDPLGLECVEGNGVNSYTTNDYRQKLNGKFGRTGNLHDDINVRQAKSTAFNFYKEQGFDEASIPSHLNGIDFNHPVEIETLNKGKKVYQYQSPGAPQEIIIQPIQKPHRPNLELDRWETIVRLVR